MTYLLQIQVDEEIKAKLETNDPYIIRDFVFFSKRHSFETEGQE